ncbi:MAG: response regulator [Candidatus Heimdallarchaeota archaeon]|nr:response regulator [Candidatus Heimdallarchaeota archaeon]
MMIVENKYKIFIAEDSFFVQQKLMELLPEFGFEIVGMATESKSAFRYVSETRPDVILLDVFLSDITAEEMIRGLLAINPNISIVLMCPLSNLREVMYLMQRGAMDYIPKPLVDSQVEYILRKYEYSQGIRPVSKIRSISQLITIFLNEILENAPRNFRNHLEKAVHKPLKRLNSRYKDRYRILFNPIRIDLLMDTNDEDKVYRTYFNQLNRLYLSVMNNLNKELPDEYVKSLLIETYQSYYTVAQYLLEETGYEFPVWKDFKLSPIKSKFLEETRIDYSYEKVYPIISKNQYVVKEKINELLRPYRIIITHDPRLVPKFPRPDSFDIESLDMHVVLSYFDDILGPTVASIAPPPHGKIEEVRLNSIPRLLDTIGAEPGDPFIHATNDFGSVNVIFGVHIPGTVRGGTRDYMLSLVITPVEVRAMVKINQMRNILRATASLINNFYTENPEAISKGSSMYVSSEVGDILYDLFDNTKTFLAE